MDSGYQLQTKAQIVVWLKSLVQRKRGPRHGPTLYTIAQHTGISRKTLERLIYSESANIGEPRRRQLSRLMAEIENGLVDFKMVGKGCHLRKVMVRPEKPKVRVRYAVTMGPRGPQLRPIDRPKAPVAMPTMRKLLGRD